MTKLIEKGDVRQWIPDEVLADHEAEGWTLLGSVEGDPPEYYVLNQGEITCDLAPLKERKWLLAKLKRDEVEHGTATTPFGPVQCDDASKLKISGLVQMAQIAAANSAPFSEVFTMADNSEVPLDASEMISLGVAVGQHVSAVFTRGRELREAIEAAQTKAELDAIDVNAGWP